MSTDSTPPAPPDKDELKQAMKAFRKRLKLTRLDEESKISRRPVTGGQSSGIVAITPPNQFPQAVWEELVRQGKLKKAGHGTYELVEE
ncbi:MAG TPA: hypothetical protein VEL76_10755 [Gemmataceae bacterium]|nr:hypothetical protein [Gemmataceae bacterium]